MKTGELARLLGITRGTINSWVHHPELERFFSPDALGENAPQATYTEGDVLILNTIHHLRTQKHLTGWTEIAQRLDAGERFREFPVSAIPTDTRTIPLQQAEQSVKAAATLAELNQARDMIDELKARINQLESDKKTLYEEIAQLNREIGRLEGKLGSG